MQRQIALLFLAGTAFAVAAAPPDADRQAILAMAGKFKVAFDFTEQVPIAPDYEVISKPYHEEALEVVTVAEDTPERITLQHLLVVEGKEGKRHVIKHWAQVWTWQDTHLLDYAGSEGDDVWKRHDVSPEQAEGKWSQLVTSVDDTPRYEALGKWTHEAGESSWSSEPTRRPLPRREYTIREDYDYLLGTNRHTLTANGWVHFQDNRKVVDRDGARKVLSYEAGLNQYVRAEDPAFAEAEKWWEKNGEHWATVRNFWIEAGEKPGESFSYLTLHDGVGLSKTFSRLEKEKPSRDEVIAALSPYLPSPESTN